MHPLPPPEISVIQEGWFTILAQRKRELIYGNHNDPPRRIISIFGGSQVEEEEQILREAFEIGRQLARHNLVVMNGGYGGIMEASAAGAAQEGGITVGVTCDNLPEREPNVHIQHHWHLERWDQRLLALVWLADGYIVMPGSSGTLVELSMVIETQSKRFIPRRPVICYGDYWRGVVERFENAREMITFALTPRECVSLVCER